MHVNAQTTPSAPTRVLVAVPAMHGAALQLYGVVGDQWVKPGLCYYGDAAVMDVVVPPHE